jgi:hydrogenase expression/formation protein HypC
MLRTLAFPIKINNNFIKKIKEKAMCLAIPALVKSIEGVTAQVEVGGAVRSTSIMLTPDVKAGDYVLLHTGYAISVIDKEEALKTLELMNQLADIEA